MTPEQMKLLTECIDGEVQFVTNNYGHNDSGVIKRIDACNELRSALANFVAEHAATKEQLRWRKLNKEPAPGTLVISRCYSEIVEYDICNGEDLCIADDPEWLPVPP